MNIIKTKSQHKLIIEQNNIGFNYCLFNMDVPAKFQDLSTSHLFFSLLLFLLAFFRISVEEQVNHDVPAGVAGKGSAQAQNLTSKQPPHQTNTVGGL